ncbi:MAG: hypothetical protein HFI34_06095 [Lachnospiraceae bacterium]|nr:hypothetical protein [Lachnospiraceae bacterium]
MITEEIKDLKKFMNFLLASDKFDTFLVNSISITTYNTFQIDGHICREFYSEDEFNDLTNQKLSSYGTLRPICYNLIKGHKTPVKMKIIFAMNESFINSLIDSVETTLTMNDVNELFINIKYENGTASCVTGTSLKIFTMDKSLEHAFDKYISEFISTLS